VKAEQNLWSEIDALRERLQEAEETLRAIRTGEVDALVILGPNGEQIFTLKGADHPYRIIVEEMSEGAVTLSLDGTILYCNHSFAALLKADLAQVIGSSMMSFVTQEEQSAFQRLFANQNHARAAMALQTADGTAVPVYISFNRVYVDENDAVCLVVTDLSEQKRHEAMLLEERLRNQAKIQESDRLAAMGMTAAVLAHEIANPLNWISTTLQLMQRELSKSQPQDSAGFLGELINIQTEINRLGTLLHEFRSLGRPLQLNLRPLNLSDFVADLDRIMLPELERAGIRFEHDISSGLPHVNADLEALKRAFINLFKNSMEAMPSGGKLTVDAYAEARELIVTITDTGTGIAGGLDIFAPFASTKEKGTGLGLMVVRQILAAHGGAISYSSNENVGTTFLLRLPIVQD
jgi:PAS domain S-box-containing protein